MNIFKHHNAGVVGHNAHSKMQDHHETPLAFLKIFIAWVMAGVAKASEVVLGLTLAEWVQIAALLFTVAQLLFLVRDKWWRDPKRKSKRRKAQYDRSIAGK